MTASSSLRVDNPYTLAPDVEVPLASDQEVGATLDRARAAFIEWKRTPIAERVALCEAAMVEMEAAATKEAIAHDITRMMGKPLGQARGEVDGMAARARHMTHIAEASLADVKLPPKENFERRIAKTPLGVVVDLPAWNYPLLTAVNVVVPAILAGNSVVVKHSPRSPLCGEHFARAFAKAGGPKNLVQALHLDHPASERMVGDSRVDAVFFTGSILGGHRIQAAAGKGFAQVDLELGGNDPAYVAEDADVQKVAEQIVDGAMYNAGQSCCAVERVFVHRSKYAAFIAACEPLVRAYVLGDPTASATSLGPIAQPAHVADLEAMVADAKAHGARIVCGGEKAQFEGKGRFFQATLLADVTPAMRLLREESFGPLLPIAVVDSDEEALARMNDSRLGLTASVWTNDQKRAERFARDLEFGTVYMNRCDALDPALPWVGVKESGRGVTLSALGFDHLTRPKAIHFRLSL